MAEEEVEVEEAGEEEVEFDVEYVGPGDDVEKEGKGVAGTPLATDSEAPGEDDPTEDQVTEIEEDPVQTAEDMKDIPAIPEEPEEGSVDVQVMGGAEEPAETAAPADAEAGGAAEGGTDEDQGGTDIAVHGAEAEEPAAEAAVEETEAAPVEEDEGVEIPVGIGSAPPVFEAVGGDIQTIEIEVDEGAEQGGGPDKEEEAVGESAPAAAEAEPAEAAAPPKEPTPKEPTPEPTKEPTPPAPKEPTPPAKEPTPKEPTPEPAKEPTPPPPKEPTPKEPTPPPKEPTPPPKEPTPKEPTPPPKEPTPPPKEPTPPAKEPTPPPKEPTPPAKEPTPPPKEATPPAKEPTPPKEKSPPKKAKSKSPEKKPEPPKEEKKEEKAKSPEKKEEPKKEKSPIKKGKKPVKKEKTPEPEPEPEPPKEKTPEPEPEPEKPAEPPVEEAKAPEAEAEPAKEPTPPVEDAAPEKVEEEPCVLAEAPVVYDDNSSKAEERKKRDEKSASPKLTDEIHRPPAPRVPTGTHYSSISPENDYSPKTAYVPYSSSVISPSRRLQRDIGHLDSIRFAPRSVSNSYLHDFDNKVATGEFAKQLWATEQLASRVLERSRQRSRDRSFSRSLSRARLNSSSDVKTRSYSVPPSPVASAASSRAVSRSSSHAALFEYIDKKEREMAPDRVQTRFERRLGLEHNEPYSRLPVLHRAYHHEPQVDRYVYRINRPSEDVLYSPFTPSFARPSVNYTARPVYTSYSSYRSPVVGGYDRPYTYYRQNYDSFASNYDPYDVSSSGRLSRSLHRDSSRSYQLDRGRSELHREVQGLTRKLDSMNWASTALSGSASGRRLESALRQRSSYGSVSTPMHHSRGLSYYY